MFAFPSDPFEMLGAMDKPYLEECLAAGMSLKQIAAECGSTAGTVGYWVNKYGLRANGAEKFDPKRRLDADDLRPLVEQGLTLREIAARVGRAPSAVGNALKRLELGPTEHMQRVHAVRAARSQGQTEIELVCRKHGRTRFKILSTGVRCKRCSSVAVAGRRRRVKQILVGEAGGSCRICGYDRDPRALEFHHVDPRQKSFAVAGSGMTRSIAAAREEVAKCVLLCSNCHAEVESGITILPATIGKEVCKRG